MSLADHVIEGLTAAVGKPNLMQYDSKSVGIIQYDSIDSRQLLLEKVPLVIWTYHAM